MVLTRHRATWPGDGYRKKDNYKMVQTLNYKLSNTDQRTKVKYKIFVSLVHPNFLIHPRPIHQMTSTPVFVHMYVE